MRPNDAQPDAALIAAAPEMLEALQQAIRYVACNEQGRCRGCGRRWTRTHVSICNAAPLLAHWRLVVAKAKGEA